MDRACALLNDVGLLSEEYYPRAARQVAKLRGVANGPSVGAPPPTSQPAKSQAPTEPSSSSRGTSRLRQRIGPLEHDSLTRIAQQLCRELDIPYSLFQSITD